MPSSDMTPELLERVETLQKSVAEAGKVQREKLIQDDKFSSAKWKIQIWIKSERTRTKPLVFTMSLWESGKRLHGGGDESSFICRRKRGAALPGAPLGAIKGRKEATNDGCDGIIPGDSIAGGHVLCPHCGVLWTSEGVADALFFRLPVERAAEVIAHWFRAAGSNADIYVKYRDQDVRTQMMARNCGVAEARRLKGLMIYPLHHIIQETTGGATLASRFKAMLLA